MFTKLAQKPEAVEIMSLYVAFLRSLYQLLQNAHWKSKGPEFYGKHLLFERLYTATAETADSAAEKCIGVFGELDSCTEIIAELCEKFDAKHFDDDFIQSTLKAEQMFLAFSQTIYDQLKEMKAITLGLDDLILSIASQHEVHVYLLKQSL